MFSIQATSFKTAKGSLRTPKAFRKYFCSSKRHRKRWLYAFVINCTFDVQNNVSSKTKLQTTKSKSHQANSRSENCSRKTSQPSNDKI